MKKFIFIALCSSLIISSCAKVKNDTLRIYAWGQYLDDELIQKFEEETGIDVDYETFISNEKMYEEIISGKKSFDLITPTDYIIERMIKEDKLQKINRSLLPNYENIMIGLQKTQFDENGEYNVPYMWGTVGIAYNKKYHKNIENWDVLFDSKNAGEIYMYDAAREIVSITLKELGYSLNTTDGDELKEAKEKLFEQKPLVIDYISESIVDKMVTEKGTLALVYSGDATAMAMQNPDIGYFVPKEGSNVWIDSFVIPKNAINTKNAYTFINFMNEPENAKYISEKTGYTTANEKALEIVAKELLYYDSYNVFVDSTVMEVYKDLGKEYLNLYEEIYEEVREN